MSITSPIDFMYKNINNLIDKKKVMNLVATAEAKWIHGPTTPFPGKHKYSRTPYMIEIANELGSESDTEEVVVMKSAQGGATAGATEPLILACVDGYGKILAFTATETLAKTWKADRIDPMIESAGLKEKLQSTSKKGSQHGGKGDGALKLEWPGGRLDIKTYGQINSVRQISYNIIILEEEEEEANSVKKGEKQGLFKDIAWARTTAFAEKGRKCLRISTPLIEETSIIYKAYMAGDQRRYNVPCIHCGGMQHLEWKNLHYTADENRIVIDDSVYYECKHCHEKIYNHDKPKFLKQDLCEWIPDNAEKARPKVKSYHFNALIYPLGMESWHDLAQMWVDAQGDPEAMQTFVNLKLGEPFKNYAERPNPELLHALQGSYIKGELPNKYEGAPLFTTLGCDVQAGNKKPGEPGYKPPRIEGSLYGFGLNNRVWLINHYVLNGEVTDWTSGAFAQLAQLLIELKKYKPYNLVHTFIDSGHQTDEVFKFCNTKRGINPIKGYAVLTKTEGTKFFKPLKINQYRNAYSNPMELFELSTNVMKRRLYNKLSMRQDQTTGSFPEGYIMFPRDMNLKFFKQLTAEVPMKKKIGNRETIVWDDGGRANEATDCYVYAEMAKEFFIYSVSLGAGEEASNEKNFWQWASVKFG